MTAEIHSGKGPTTILVPIPMKDLSGLKILAEARRALLEKPRETYIPGIGRVTIIPVSSLRQTLPPQSNKPSTEQKMVQPSAPPEQMGSNDAPQPPPFGGEESPVGEELQKQVLNILTEQRPNISRTTALAHAFNPAKLQAMNTSQKNHASGAHGRFGGSSQATPDAPNKPIAKANGHAQAAQAKNDLSATQTTDAAEELLRLLAEAQLEGFATTLESKPPLAKNAATPLGQEEAIMSALVDKAETAFVNPGKILEQMLQKNQILSDASKQLLLRVQAALSDFDKVFQSAFAGQTSTSLFSPLFQKELGANPLLQQGAGTFIEKTLTTFAKLFAPPGALVQSLPLEAQIALKKSLPALLLLAQTLLSETTDKLLLNRANTAQVLEEALKQLATKGDISPHAMQVLRNIVQNQTIITILLPYLSQQEKMARLRKKKKKKTNEFDEEEYEEEFSEFKEPL